MGVIKRVRQAATAIGFLVILAGIAMAGVAVYLWWDSKKTSEDIEIGADLEPDHDTSEEQDELEA